MKRLVLVVAGATLLASCETVPEEEVAVHPDAHALAQAACAGCHSVEPMGLSPNPDAPEWPVIANTPGLTRQSLTVWLTDAHAYPEEMDFYLEADEVDMLVGYILSLKDENYHPPY